MPDDPRPYRAVPRDSGKAPDPANQQATGKHSVQDEPPPPASRRRRSMEDSGVVSVSDLVRRNNTGRHAAPAPQQPSSTNGHGNTPSAEPGQPVRRPMPGGPPAAAHPPAQPPAPAKPPAQPPAAKPPAERQPPAEPPAARQQARQEPRRPQRLPQRTSGEPQAPARPAEQPPATRQTWSPAAPRSPGTPASRPGPPRVTSATQQPVTQQPVTQSPENSRRPPPQASQQWQRTQASDTGADGGRAEPPRRAPPQARRPDTAQPSAQDAPAGRALPTGTTASSTGMSRPVTRPTAPERHTGRPDNPAEARRGAPPVPPARDGTARAATPQDSARPLPSRDEPAGQSTTGASRVPPRRPEPERPENMDPSLLTDEMEPVGQEVRRRRKVDDTLARFSAVHDEMVEDERRRRGRMSRILPWVSAGDELDEALATPPVRRHDPRQSQDSGPASRGEQGRRAGATRFVAPSKAVGQPEGDEATRLAEPLGAAADGMHEDSHDGTAGSHAASARDDEPLSRLQAKKQRRQRRAALVGKITAISAATLVFLVTGVAWGAKVWLNAKFTEIDALDENSSAIQNAARQSGDQNFLLVGSDTRAGGSGNAKVGTDKQVKGARSDTVMIAHIPANRKRVVMVSFPR
ncbi:MAG: hypothetical protein ACRDQ5_07895, partial [Sciscionella sp.]